MAALFGVVNFYLSPERRVVKKLSALALMAY